MKQTLLFIWMFAALGLFKPTFSQTTTVEIPIIQNGEMATDTLEGGIVVTFGLSSDDAEQENDEMDTLHDDDLDAGWEGDPEDLNVLTAGLRFQSVAVPKGATIESAYLVLTSHEAKTAEDVAIITISGHKISNAPTFTMDELITSRIQTNAKVTWEVSEEWGLWTTHQSADFSSIIQEIIDMPGWSYGNAIALLLLGQNQGVSDYENAREFESFENISDPEDGGDGQNHPERVPKLVIEYSFTSTIFESQIVGNGDVVTDTLENGMIVTYQLSSDDAEQENDEMDSLHDDDLDAGWEGDPEDLNVLSSGLRFQNITIPGGVSIDSAFIVVCSHEAKNAEDVAIITIAGEATDNAATFTMDQLITDRPQTEAIVTWEVAEEWGLWTYHRTPDISSIIQEIIDRDGWQPGNSVALFLLGQNQGVSDYENAREFESFENISDPEDGGDGQNHPERVPKLVVYYSGSQGVHGSMVKKQALDIYPNPAHEQITVKLHSEKPAQITIFNLSGSKVKQVQSEKNSFLVIDINEFPKGLYTIQVVQDQTIYSQRFIVD